MTGLARQRAAHELLDALRRSIGASPRGVILHSSLIDLRPGPDMGKWDYLAILRQLLDEGHSIALPAFTFSYCTGRPFHWRESPSETGQLADWALQLPEFRRTPHPIYSFAIAGPMADGWMSAGNETTFGDDSIFALFERDDARVVMLGASWEFCTYFHRIEESCEVPYRFYKDFTGSADLGEGSVSTTARMFVRNLETNPENDFTELVQALDAAGAVTNLPVWSAGQGISSANCRDITRIGNDLVTRRPYALVRNAALVSYDTGNRRARQSHPPLTVAVAANATISPFAQALEKALLKYVPDREVQVLHTDFGQALGDMMNPESAIASGKPAVTIIANRLEDLAGRFSLAGTTEEDITSLIERYCHAIRQYRVHSGGWLLVHGFASVLGDEAAGLHDGTSGSLHDIANRLLREKLGAVERLRIIDIVPVMARSSTVFDARLWHLGRFPYSPGFDEALAEFHCGHVLAATGRTARLIAVDLDNTLWGGVLGEDGLENLEIGGDHPGNAFANLQHVLKSLSASGIALAICSKNDDADALATIENLSGMVLRPDDFVSRRINWEPKWQNLASICEELSLGPANVLFIDDNPVEREQMRLNLPEVKVLDLPSDPSLYAQALLASPWITRLEVTSEDSRRVESYKARRQIMDLQNSAADLDSFHASLRPKVHFFRLSKGNRARALQLFQKTNQFNTTTRRYDAADLEEIEQAGGKVAVLGLEDRFSELENIGVLVLRQSTEMTNWLDVDDYLMSCRVLGRGIEANILRYTALRARQAGYRGIIGRIMETPRNKPVRRIFADAGFSNGGEPGLWRLEFDSIDIDLPDWLSVEDEIWEDHA